jgi:hypothetical protein
LGPLYGFVQNNDGGFMHYLMKRNADLKNILRILVLKKPKVNFEKIINLGLTSDANVV